MCEGLPSMKMWPQKLAKPGLWSAHWSLCSTQLGHMTDMLSCSGVSRALDAQIQVHTPATLSARTATDAQGSSVLGPLQLGSLRHPTLSPEGTRVRVLSRLSPQASWEIYCPGNEGRDRLRKRREGKGEVRKKRKMEKREEAWGEEKRGGRVKEREREGRKEEWGRKSRDGVRKKRDIL